MNVMDLALTHDGDVCAFVFVFFFLLCFWDDGNNFFCPFFTINFFFRRLIGTNHMSVKKSRSRCTDKIQNFHSQIIFILYSHLSRKNVWNCGVFFFLGSAPKKIVPDSGCTLMIYVFTWRKKYIPSHGQCRSFDIFIWNTQSDGWLFFFWFWFLFCGLIQ